MLSYALPASCPSFFAFRPDWIARPGEEASMRFVPRVVPIRPSIRCKWDEIVVAYVGDRTQCEDGTFDLVICCDASISYDIRTIE